MSVWDRRGVLRLVQVASRPSDRFAATNAEAITGRAMLCRER